MVDPPSFAEVPPSRPTLRERLAQFEASVGLPQGFLRDLRTDDDWTFVIKAHAVLEAALSELLTHEIGREELRETFTDMSTGGKFGKKSFAMALGLLPPDVGQFIDGLSTLRNACVHHVANVNLHLETYFAGLKPDKATQLARSLDLVFPPEPVVKGRKKKPAPVAPVEYFQREPKTVIHASLTVVLDICNDRTVKAKQRAPMDPGLQALFRVELMRRLGEPSSDPLPSESPGPSDGET